MQTTKSVRTALRLKNHGTRPKLTRKRPTSRISDTPRSTDSTAPTKFSICHRRRLRTPNSWNMLNNSPPTAVRISTLSRRRNNPQMPSTRKSCNKYLHSQSIWRWIWPLWRWFKPIIQSLPQCPLHPTIHGIRRRNTCALHLHWWCTTQKIIALVSIRRRAGWYGSPIKYYIGWVHKIL